MDVHQILRESPTKSHWPNRFDFVSCRSLLKRSSSSSASVNNIIIFVVFTCRIKYIVLCVGVTLRRCKTRGFTGEWWPPFCSSIYCLQVIGVMRRVELQSGQCNNGDGGGIESS